MDIEGAEYEVLNSLIEDNLNIRIVCVEFNQPTSFARIFKMVQRLQRWNYSLVAIDGWNYTFIQGAWSEVGAG